MTPPFDEPHERSWRARHPGWQCPHCGYDRGDGYCQECGQDRDDQERSMNVTEALAYLRSHGEPIQRASAKWQRRGFKWYAPTASQMLTDVDLTSYALNCAGDDWS